MAGSIALKKYVQDKKILPTDWKIKLVDISRFSEQKMASITMVSGVGILYAASFSGGNYLTEYLSGDSGKALLDEETQHDKALEAQAAMGKHTHNHTNFLEWIETNREIKE